MGLSSHIEPDPDFDVTLDIELRRKFYTDEIGKYIREGVFSARRIVRKLYDPDDPTFTKAVILQLIREVLQELKEGYRGRTIVDEALAFLEQNEEMIMRSNKLIDRCDRPRDAISAINTVAALWKDRMSFYQNCGVKLDLELELSGSKEDKKQISDGKAERMKEMHEEADVIEAEYIEVEAEQGVAVK